MKKNLKNVQLGKNLKFNLLYSKKFRTFVTMTDNLRISQHQLDRISERFEVFTSKDIKFAVKNHIKHNLALLGKVKLPKDKSFGIKLCHFVPNKESKHYKVVDTNRAYYSIVDDSVIHDSTGDQFWVVIRHNKITTFMLRKSIQTQDLEHNLEKLRVDEVIIDLPKFIKENN